MCSMLSGILRFLHKHTHFIIIKWYVGRLSHMHRMMVFDCLSLKQIQFPLLLARECLMHIQRSCTHSTVATTVRCVQCDGIERAIKWAYERDGIKMGVNLCATKFKYVWLFGWSKCVSPHVSGSLTKIWAHKKNVHVKDKRFTSVWILWIWWRENETYRKR